MSDLYALAYMGSIALTCGLTVALIDALRQPLDEPLVDESYGDVPAIPGDFKAFHSATNNEGEQLNHGAR